MTECPTCGCTNAEMARQCEKCASPLLGTDLRCGLYTYCGTSNGQVLQMRYIIARELSSDITGVKYLAEDAEEKKDVIIWALPTIAAVDEDKIQSISELCDSLNKLTDEHILNVCGVYSKNDARYFVTEYVEGCSLAEKIASEGPLNPEETLEIFSPLAQCLDYAHKHGFIHGDINPSNILISSKGVVKLANFVISKAIKDMLATLSPEEDVKPSFYTAPELLKNAPVSAKSDIYSLAACISRSLDKKSEKQNEVLLRSLSANPQDRPGSTVELLTELSDSSANLVVEKEVAEPEQISYEKSLADLKQKTREWSRELEEAINTLTTEAERGKQKHAEILRQVQTQARQQAEQLRADYEGKTEQLKAKIEQAQAELATALNEVNRKTEALVAEKENALKQSREHEENINKLIADAEREKQKHAEMLNKARGQIREQAQQQLADYEERIIQLKAKIADAELAAIATLGQTDQNTEALTEEKEKALQRSREHEEAVRKLIADAEKEKQQHSEILSHTQTQVRQQAEQQFADYEGKINRLKTGIAEAEAKLAAAVSEADRKAEELAAEKGKALQRSREYEEVIKKLAADAEGERRQLTERLNLAQTQTGQQAEQQRADYEQKIEQLKKSIADAQYTAAMNEAEHKAHELVAEKKKAIQLRRDYEETIKKLTADAENEKQKHTELLSQTETQARQQAEQQRAGYEKEIEKLKAMIADAQSQIAAALGQAHRNAAAMAVEKEKALQQNREHEEALEKLRSDAKKQQHKYAEHLNRAQREIGKFPSRPKISIIAFAMGLVVVCGIATGYLYLKAEKQNKHSPRQSTTVLSSAKQNIYETPAEPTGSTPQNGIVQTESEKTVPQQTPLESTEETITPEAKTPEMPASAGEKQTTLAQIEQIQTKLQEWLETASVF